VDVGDLEVEEVEEGSVVHGVGQVVAGGGSRRRPGRGDGRSLAGAGGSRCVGEVGPGGGRGAEGEEGGCRAGREGLGYG